MRWCATVYAASDIATTSVSVVATYTSTPTTAAVTAAPSASRDRHTFTSSSCSSCYTTFSLPLFLSVRVVHSYAT